MADTFVNSIGVNVHFGYGAMLQEARRLVYPALQELGVRHIRDGVSLAAEGMVALRDACRGTGVQATLICDPESASVGNVRRIVASFYKPALVAALEGTNEPDGKPPMPGRPDPMLAATVYQRQLYAMVRYDPAFRHILVYGPSLVHAASVPYLLPAAAAMDATNLHPYPGGRNPETGGWGDTVQGVRYGSLAYARVLLGKAVRADLPSVITETGYPTTLRDNGVSEHVAARYLPRLLLQTWRMGFIRTFLYELMDSATNPGNVEANFGLLRYDGSRKPGFASVRDLVRLLADPGPGFATGRLAYKLDGDAAGVQACLLQKRDAAFYLAVWAGSQIWDPDRYLDMPTGPRSLTLRLGRQFAGIAVNTPHDGRGWERKAQGDSVQLHLEDGVCLVRMIS